MTGNQENRIWGVFRLVRLPNVLMVVLTQVLLQYCIILPLLYPGENPGVGLFVVLVVVTALITAGGYVINDYFDIHIDRVNRPHRAVVEHSISGRTAIAIHMIVNAIAVLLGFYLAWRVKSISFGFLFPFISALLWIYSARYKRQVLLGNLIVAALTALVILVVWLLAFLTLRLDPVHFAEMMPGLRDVTSLAGGYALFAFLISLVREIIKDAEDIEGDELAGCKTLPVVAGIQISKMVAGGVLLFTMAILVYAQAVMLQRSFNILSLYFLLTVQPACVYFLYRLYRAQAKADFHFLSLLSKLIMLAGVLSMLIPYILN